MNPSVQDAHSEHPNQFALLRQRRFAPFFWTQFCGAANDNLFKFAFTVMVTYQLQVSWLPASLAGGNGMVEMGTFVAILLGQVAGGLLVAVPAVGHAEVAVACVLLALLGRGVAQAIPATPATDPGLKINWNPVSETWRNLRLARENVVVFRSLLGISWMWFFGAVFLSQFPSFAKEVLHGDEKVASLLLVV